MPKPKIELLLHRSNTPAMKRLSFSMLHQARSTFFLPWKSSSSQAMKKYNDKFGESGREIKIGNIGVVNIKGPLWRVHRNLLATLMVNIKPKTLENGDTRLYYTNSWLAKKLGYKHPDSAGVALINIIKRLEETKLVYRIYNYSENKSRRVDSVIETTIISKYGPVGNDDLNKRVCLGMHFVDVSAGYRFMFNYDMSIRAMPETIDQISQIDSAIWQTVIEYVLSHRDYCNKNIEQTFKDIGLTESGFGDHFVNKKYELLADQENRQRIKKIFRIEIKKSHDNRDIIHWKNSNSNSMLSKKRIGKFTNNANCEVDFDENKLNVNLVPIFYKLNPSKETLHK